MGAYMVTRLVSCQRFYKENKMQEFLENTQYFLLSTEIKNPKVSYGS